MHFSLVPLALSLLTTSASAIPLTAHLLPLRTADPTNPALTWNVTGFSVGCSPGGCAYNFNISGLGSPNTPAFNTSCNGTTVQSDYAACKDPGVLAQVIPAQHPNWTVKAQHVWREGADTKFYALGQKNVTAETKVFTIPVTQVYGVA